MEIGSKHDLKVEIRTESGMPRIMICLIRLIMLGYMESMKLNIANLYLQLSPLNISPINH